jgi:hypothetical protein
MGTGSDDGHADPIEIHIDPRFDDLEALGITLEDLEEALPPALDAYHDRIEGRADAVELPDLEDLTVVVQGRSFRLGDIADIAISEPPSAPGTDHEP